MAKRQRNYKAEYEARQQKARAMGWRSYNERRRARREFAEGFATKFGDKIPPSKSQKYEDMVQSYWAMVQEDRTGVPRGDNEWRYELFVEEMDYLTPEEWDERYPPA